MTRRERGLFWLLLLGATGLFLVVLADVLLPFVAGLAIAYLLDPIVDRLERAGCGRTIGATLVLCGFVVVACGFLLLLVPVVNAQLLRLAELLPGVVARIEPVVRSLLENVHADARDGSLESLPSLAGGVLPWITRTLARVVSGGVAITNLLSLVLITPIVAFYLLRDWDRLVRTISGWLPQAQGPVIREQAGLIDRTLASFVRGQGSVCLVLMVYYGTALSLAGLDFGIVVGIFVGGISFIPFVGAILGGVLSISLAAIQFPDWQPIVIVGVIFVIGQVLEGNVLTPKLVGDAVGLHPVWVIFALLAGGTLFGFVGVLLSLPVAAIIGVIGRFALDRYLASPLHLHGIPPADDAGEPHDRDRS